MYVTVPNQFPYSLLAMGSLGESDAITEEFYNKVKWYFLPLHFERKYLSNWVGFNRGLIFVK